MQLNSVSTARMLSVVLALGLGLSVMVGPGTSAAQVGQAVEFGDKLTATLNTFKKMSDGTYKVEFTVKNDSDKFILLGNYGLNPANICGVSLLDLTANKRYFPLKSPEGCVGSRGFDNTVHAEKSIRLWLRFPKLPPEVKTVSLDLKAVTFDDLPVE